MELNDLMQSFAESMQASVVSAYLVRFAVSRGTKQLSLYGFHVDLLRVRRCRRQKLTAKHEPCRSQVSAGLSLVDCSDFCIGADDKRLLQRVVFENTAVTYDRC